MTRCGPVRCRIGIVIEPFPRGLDGEARRDLDIVHDTLEVGNPFLKTTPFEIDLRRVASFERSWRKATPGRDCSSRQRRILPYPKEVSCWYQTTSSRSTRKCSAAIPLYPNPEESTPAAEPHHESRAFADTRIAELAVLRILERDGAQRSGDGEKHTRPDSHSILLIGWRLAALLCGGFERFSIGGFPSILFFFQNELARFSLFFILSIFLFLFGFLFRIGFRRFYAVSESFFFRLPPSSFPLRPSSSPRRSLS